MKLILTDKAKKVMALVKKGNSTNEISSENIDGLGQFVDGVKSSSDDFWYSLTNGYIDYESFLADKNQLKAVEDAIKLISLLEEVVTEIGPEW